MTIASVGYNGFPKNMKDYGYLYDDRDIKLSRIIHAEMNAILHAREPLHGYTLYTWPMMSCDRCAVLVIQAGITRIVAPTHTGVLAERWKTSLIKSEEYFAEASIRVKLYNLGKR